MPPQPQTPTKADDGIEKLKLSLSTKWGIQWPIRDALWSPSRKDPNRVEDKILACIQYLYFRNDALAYAVEQFEKHVLVLCSGWQFKPHAELDVLPSIEPHKSFLRHEFLRKRDEIPKAAVKELTEILWSTLSQIAERAKAGEIFRKSESGCNVTDSLSVRDICADISRDPKLISTETPSKPDVSTPRQPSLTDGFRSRSELGPSRKTATVTVQHPSSDDSHDEDMLDVFDEIGKMEVSPLPSLGSSSKNDRNSKEGTQIWNQDSPIEEEFKTPPTTPPRRNFENAGLELGMNEHTVGSKDPGAHVFKTTQIAVAPNIKRSFPEPMKPPLPRKGSREMRNHDVPKIVSKVGPLSHEDYTAPTPPPEDVLVPSNPGSSSRSLGILTSVSSMTSASSAWTSPDTSFSAESLATSFNSTVEGTDGKKRRSYDDLSVSKCAHNEYNGVEKTSVDKVWDRLGEGPMVSKEYTTPPDGSMDLDSDSTATYIPTTKYGATNLVAPVTFKPIQTNIGDLLADRLKSYPPFATQLPQQSSAIPFRQLYEITRVSITCRIDPVHFSACFNYTYESYNALWSALISIVQAREAHIPERSSITAWDRAGGDFEGVALSGKLKFINRNYGPFFSFQLNPLKLEPSYRLSRQFGSDRFCVIGIPGLAPGNLPQYLKGHHALAREAITKWLVDTEHHILGRTWRAFYTKYKKKKSENSFEDIQFRVYFFAENGTGFRQERRFGETNTRILDRPQMSVKDMLEWFMPFKSNEEKPCLKFFARLALGVSSTIATVEFRPSEIFRADDARADAPPAPWHLSYSRSDEKKRQENPAKSEAPTMNDGCARISRNAARGIADKLGLHSVPCIFQGRIGGAKGVWMVDTLGETPAKQDRNYWIEITDAQLKFEGHAIDAFDPVPARITFEVNDYVKKLSSSSLKFQLLPILVDRGVPREVFEMLVEKDLSARMGELEVAMDSALTLRKWNQDVNSTVGERIEHGGIEMQGGLPFSRAEKINWFVEHGFEPGNCLFLNEQLRTAMRDYCQCLKSKMKIGLGLSTYAFMIADPLAVLEENEVHIGFSSSFQDHNSDFDQTMLHNLDILVARIPAHLPSDIQKVRAVFKPELMSYRDVIVFPSKGPVSLASKLSGGDYDGDKAWICWDPKIVEPFTNADVPPSPGLATFGIEVDEVTVSDVLQYPDYIDRFLRHAFDFNLQTNMLGKCASYHEAYCYRVNTINDSHAVSLALLLGNLVDSAKGGFKFDETRWFQYKNANKLSQILPEPAYKDRTRTAPAKLDHTTDYLVFKTVTNVIDDTLAKFSKHIVNISSRDDDLFRIRNEEQEEAKRNIALASVLKNLGADLESINSYWGKHTGPYYDKENYQPGREVNPLSFRTVVERCRTDFLSIKPVVDEDSVAVNSDRIASWQRNHSHGLSSHWDLLKASVAYYRYHWKPFVWNTAGVELGEIKATARGRGTYRPVRTDVFVAMKLDNKVVDSAKRREMLDKVGDSKGEVYDDGDDDDDAQYGDWDWDIDEC